MLNVLEDHEEWLLPAHFVELKLFEDNTLGLPTGRV